MANTYTLIASYTATGTVSNIDFTSIPSTYTDLLVKWSTRTPNTTPTADNIIIRFNGSSSNGTVRTIYGNGSSAYSANDTSIYAQGGTVGGAATASTYSNGELYVPNYAGSNNKSVSIDTVTENNATAANASLSAGLWSITTAINQITLVPNYANFSIYSTAYLYGIKNS